MLAHAAACNHQVCGTRVRACNGSRHQVAIHSYTQPLPLIVHCCNPHEAGLIWQFQRVIRRTVGTKIQLNEQDIGEVVAAIRQADFIKTLLRDLKHQHQSIYVVIRGKWAGIFLTWDHCEPQVLGVSDAMHRSFKRWDDAFKYYMTMGKGLSDDVDEWAEGFSSLHIQDEPDDNGSDSSSTAQYWQAVGDIDPALLPDAGDPGPVQRSPSRSTATTVLQQPPSGLTAATVLHTSPVRPSSSPIRSQRRSQMGELSTMSPSVLSTSVPLSSSRTSIASSPSPASVPTSSSQMQPFARGARARRTLNTRDAQHTVTSLGYWPDLYLEQHGYTQSARSLVIRAYVETTDEAEFVRRLHGQDVPADELIFLYRLTASSMHVS
ncbi:hypothetical protein EVJ58_g719 [Rhodofomes roseus]|uniref:Ribonuclease H1 N-terminal domain-containing protein n=1 Tax=Rhodofomes roseus TaxID=34475 RepID=A0A4Y9Z536_9APHY|nr:hypothetical protein EVJ58_g719 [Rhodofomes roseus]